MSDRAFVEFGGATVDSGLMPFPQDRALMVGVEPQIGQIGGISQMAEGAGSLANTRDASRPEPSSFLCLLTGLGAVGGLMWRRRK